MATNSVTQAALVGLPIPPDLACVKDAQSIQAMIIATCAISGLASQVGGQGVVPSNNVANQALTIANQALAAVNALALRVPTYRGSPNQIGIIAGDSVQTLTWTDLGTTNYVLSLTLYGPSGHPGAYYNWRAVDGSQSSTGISISFDNIPSGFSFSWLVSTIPL